MTKRRDTTSHEECLHVFGAAFRKEVKNDLKFWKSQNPEIADTRRATYKHVLFILKTSAEEAGVPMQDLGFEDYEVPRWPCFGVCERPLLAESSRPGDLR